MKVTTIPVGICFLFFSQSLFGIRVHRVQPIELPDFRPASKDTNKNETTSQQGSYLVALTSLMKDVASSPSQSAIPKLELVSFAGLMPTPSPIPPAKSSNNNSGGSSESGNAGSGKAENPKGEEKNGQEEQPVVNNIFINNKNDRNLEQLTTILNQERKAQLESAAKKLEPALATINNLIASKEQKAEAIGKIEEVKKLMKGLLENTKYDEFVTRLNDVLNKATKPETSQPKESQGDV